MIYYEPLRKLIAKAREEGKWLQETCQGNYFSPRKLEEANRDGRFRWGADNWKLIDPKKFVKYIDNDIKELEEKKARLLKRIEEENSY